MRILPPLSKEEGLKGKPVVTQPLQPLCNQEGPSLGTVKGPDSEGVGGQTLVLEDSSKLPAEAAWPFYLQPFYCLNLLSKIFLVICK